MFLIHFPFDNYSPDGDGCSYERASKLLVLSQSVLFGQNCSGSSFSGALTYLFLFLK